MGWAHNTQVGFELPIYDVAPESSPVLCSCKKDLVGVLDDEPEIRVPMPLAVLGWAVLGVYAKSLTDIDHWPTTLGYVWFGSGTAKRWSTIEQEWSAMRYSCASQKLEWCLVIKPLVIKNGHQNLLGARHVDNGAVQVRRCRGE